MPFCRTGLVAALSIFARITLASLATGPTSGRRCVFHQLVDEVRPAGGS